jgi:hypothetical protein
MKKYHILIFLAIWVSAISVGIWASANALAASTITVDNANRREYTYCPLSDTDVKSFGGEIDGCPVVRVYVNNWSTLTPTEQTTIDTLLRSKGFVDSGENILK